MSATTATFKSPLDRATRFSTALALGVLGMAAIVLGVVTVAQANAGRTTSAVVLAAATACVPALIIAVRAFAPTGYEVNHDSVRVCRSRWRDILIPMSEIAGVRAIELHRVIRVMGVGGMFGSWGRFTSRQLPSFRGYVTRRSHLVCLDLSDGDHVVVSPDDPDRFIAAVRRELGRGKRV